MYLFIIYNLLNIKDWEYIIYIFQTNTTVSNQLVLFGFIKRIGHITHNQMTSINKYSIYLW